MDREQAEEDFRMAASKLWELSQTDLTNPTGVKDVRFYLDLMTKSVNILDVRLCVVRPLIERRTASR